jgi:hypothetical protein
MVMTWRDTIADLISGGAITRMRSQMRICARIDDEALQEALDAYHACDKEVRALKSALQAIAEQETPGANATVRRMARMARGASEW